MSPGTHGTERWVGSRSRLGVVVKEEKEFQSSNPEQKSLYWLSYPVSYNTRIKKVVPVLN
jgi:hypothetical protein